MTDSDDLAASARLLRNQATLGRTYWHARIGFSYRMTNLQAAVGLAQLERVMHFITARQRIAHLYDSCLSQLAGLVPYEEPDWSSSVCWLYALLVEAEFGMCRDDLIAYLASKGVESQPFFRPVPQLPAYRDGQAYPVAEHLAQCGICLPTYVKLQPSQIVYIAGLIQQASCSPSERP
jgi:perosamine synthetase